MNGKNSASTSCLLLRDPQLISGRQPHAWDRSLARLSGDAYMTSGEGADGWQPLSRQDLYQLGVSPFLMENAKSGFKARLYVHEVHGYALAFRGTDERKDWVSNYRQSISLQAEQYVQANRLAEVLEKALGDSPLVITGHSLGGGLASIAALRIGVPAVTFNAAGIHDSTLRRFDLPGNSRELAAQTGQIRRYTVDNEILTALQEHAPQTRMILPDGIGHRIRLVDPEPLSILERAFPHKLLGHSLEAHSMDTVLRAIDSPRPVFDRPRIGEALIAESIRGIRRLEDLRQIPTLPGQGLVNAAVFIAARARETGMTRVDHVACDANGDRLFAIQGSVMDPAQRRVAVGTDAAVSGPLQRNAEAARATPPDAAMPPLVPRIDWQQAHHVLGGH